jgi:hypothetical protein
MLLGWLLAQAAVSPSATPTTTPTPVVLYVIRPPDGWQVMPLPSTAPGQFELLSITVGPTANGFRSNLNVLRDVLADPSETVAARAQESVDYMSSHNGGKVISSHAERVCSGTRDGWYLESTGHYSRDVDLVQTSLLDSSYEYVATYTRAIGTPADPAALKALDTLCPQPGASTP